MGSEENGGWGGKGGMRDGDGMAKRQSSEEIEGNENGRKWYGGKGWKEEVVKAAKI